MGPESSISPLWAFWKALGPSAGCWTPAGARTSQKPLWSQKGRGFVSSEDTSKAKNYIPGRSKYACLEKLLAFMKSLVRKAGLQMTASERQ